ncbi:glycosyltransferase [Rubrobacter taiwanensis]|jgi:GT2 family glycosyltransferase|uniref:Glycosyltransferase n=1 Tax=Rubrobacter taiwanensis TaxID=185139 RepID=A0A4R1BI90_9ACTN|nr:glycosyltransferase [Rubrobacter taiwanensis]
MAVVVATRNRREELLRSLGRLVALPERPEIAVVDNASTDGTPEAVPDAYPQVRVIPLERNLGAAARTVGVRAVRAPYVAFADDDSWWEPGALARAADLLDAHPRLGLVAARILVGPEEREDPICAGMRESPLPEDRPDLPGRPVLGFLACAAAVRRQAYLQAGGFIPGLGVGGEEEFLAADLAAAGWGVRYVEELTVHHYPSALRDARERRRTATRNALWFLWLRRPLPVAARRTLRVLAALPRGGVSARGVADALLGAPGLMRRRRAVPPHVERSLRALDGS